MALEKEASTSEYAIGDVVTGAISGAAAGAALGAALGPLFGPAATFLGTALGGSLNAYLKTLSHRRRTRVGDSTGSSVSER